MTDSTRWLVSAALPLFVLNWAAVLIAASALTWRRREGAWPQWRPLFALAGGIARHPRMRPRTMAIAAQLLFLDMVATLAYLLVR